MVPSRRKEASPMTPDLTDAELDELEANAHPSFRGVINAMRRSIQRAKAKDAALEECITILSDSDYGEDIALRDAIDHARAALDKETDDADG